MSVDVITVAEAAKVLYGHKKRYYSVHRLIYKKRLRSARKIGWIWVLSRKEVYGLKKSKKY